MSCLECTDCLDLGTYDICCEEVFIGRMPEEETEYLLLIKDLSLNSIIRQVYESSPQGDVPHP